MSSGASMDMRYARSEDTYISLETFNAIVDACKSYNRDNFDPGLFDVVDLGPGLGKMISLRVSELTFPWDLLGFGYKLEGDVVTIYDGTLRIHGKGTWDWEEDTINLTSNPSWVFVEFDTKDGTVVQVYESATEPKTKGRWLRVPLYKFTADEGSFELARISNMGDVQFGAVMR